MRLHRRVKQEFLGLPESYFENCEKLSYEAKLAFFCQLAEMANAVLKFEI